jgi:hypothetical protein
MLFRAIVPLFISIIVSNMQIQCVDKMQSSYVKAGDVVTIVL